MTASLNGIFVNYAADILTDTVDGLSAAQMIRACAAYAIEYGVDLRHAAVPYEARNKRTALAENLLRFEEPQRYRIIRELCELAGQVERLDVRRLKLQLITR